MRALLILLLLCVSAHAREACSSTPRFGNGDYWSWRLIDGRKCWYIGRPNKAKSELYWRIDAPPTRPVVARAAPPVIREAPRQEEPPPRIVEQYQEEPRPELTKDALLASVRVWPTVDAFEPSAPPPPQTKQQQAQFSIWVLILSVVIMVGAVLLLPTLARRVP